MKPQEHSLFEEIFHQIQLLAKKQQILKEQNRVLHEEIEAMRDLFRKKEAHLAELKAKNGQLQAALSLQAPNEGARDFQIKLDKLIREVDKCVDLLEG